MPVLGPSPGSPLRGGASCSADRLISSGLMRNAWPYVVILALSGATACTDPGDGDGSSDTDTDPGSGPTDTEGTDTDGTDTDGTDTDGTDTDTGDGEVTECGTVLEPAPNGTCAVNGGGNGGMVLRGTVLAPEDTLRGGEVFVDAGGRIACVDCDCSGTPGYDDAAVVTCAGGVISPGLINPHEHLGFAANRPIGDGPQRYDHRHEWRTGAGGNIELSVDGGASQEEVLAAELRYLMSGVTSIAGAGGESGLIRNLDISSLLEGLPVSAVNTDTFPLDDANGTLIEQGCNYGGGATTASQIANESAYLPHIAEGINQAARNELTCTSMGELDLVARQTAVVHAVGVGALEAQLLGDDFTRVVWSPRSNIVLYGNTAPVTLLDRMGVALSLGTDWVASGSMNMLRELRCADELNDNYYDGYFSDADLWKMVTTNGALATGTHEAIGMLKPGYVADIAVYAAGDRVDHQAVVEAELQDVVLVMRGGDALYGDDAVMAAPGVGKGNCESMDVCGTAKRACVADDAGPSLQAVTSAIESTYPLFYCDVPQDEPSCTPVRAEYSGIQDGDADGDGVGDDSDNCPSVFNPARPFDQGGQADADQDGNGDACDMCPLDEGDACAGLSGADLDADGVLNGDDNCPLQPNGDQADGDDDGKGDVCDSCGQANPGASGCSASIAAIRNPNDPAHPNEGSSVTISGVYVTAVRDDGSGFVVQDDSLEPWTGITAFGSAGGLQVGDRVTVSGTYAEFFDLSQIEDAAVTVEASGALPFGAIAFDVADLVSGPDAEQYESMLVSIGGVSITVVNPDDPEDFDEFEITSGYRVDDQLFGAIDNMCAVDETFDGITGVQTYSFGNYKLLPRDANDFDNASCSPF